MQFYSRSQFIMTQCLSVCLSAGSALHGVNAQRLQPANSSPRHFHPAAFTPQPRKPDDEQLLWRCSGCNCDATVARLPCSGRATTVRRMEVARFRSAISKIRRREKMTQMQTYGQDCYHRLPILTSTKICSIPTQTSAMGKPPRWRAVTSRLASRFAVVTID